MLNAAAAGQAVPHLLMQGEGVGSLHAVEALADPMLCKLLLNLISHSPWHCAADAW